MRVLAYGLGLVAMASIGLASTVGAATAPTIILSDISGPVGTPVTVTGSGFPPGEVVALYIDQPDPYLYLNPPPGPRAKADGTFAAQFKWPGANYDTNHRVDPTKPGVHEVCGDTGYPGNPNSVAVKACAQFTVVGVSPTPTPAAGSDQGPSLPLPIIGAAIVLVLALAIGGQVWLQRQSKT